MSAPNSEEINVGVEVYCAAEPEKVAELCSLLREMLRHIPSPGVPYLKSIFLVADDQYVSTINTIIQSNDPTASPYLPGTHTPSGSAVPIEGRNGLSCFIVLAESLVQKMGPGYWHPEAMSTVLEELLHVWVYGSVWQRSGMLYPPPNAAKACEQAVLGISRRMHDEYVVNRTKAGILATIPLYQLEGKGGWTTVGIKYGGQVASEIDRGAVSLKRLIINAANGSLPIAEAWPQALESAYRGILEPLARSAAFDAVTPEKNEREQDPEDSLFYRLHIAPFWGRIRQQLERSFSSDLAASEDALQEIVAEATAFLAAIGISYRTTPEGDSWVDFDPRFFSRFP